MNYGIIKINEYESMLWSFWISFKTKINTHFLFEIIYFSWFIFRKNCAKGRILKRGHGRNFA